jgi:hypothetical protein
LNRELLLELQEYVETHLNVLVYSIMESVDFKSEEMEIEAFIQQKRQEPFNQLLFKFIDKKGVSDSTVYKKACLDRKLFSKIRSNPQYRAGKNTVVALALALELNKKETDKLLSSAGFSLSDSETFDLVIQFCIEKKIYDIHEVNGALDYFSLKPLSGAAE